MGPSEFALEKPHFLGFPPVFGEPLILSILHLRLAETRQECFLKVLTMPVRHVRLFGYAGSLTPGKIVTSSKTTRVRVL